VTGPVSASVNQNASPKFQLLHCETEAALLFDPNSFEFYRAHNVFVGQLSKLCLRLGVADMTSVPSALVGLVSQVDGALTHERHPRAMF
jgi:hypothetical protein